MASDSSSSDEDTLLNISGHYWPGCFIMARNKQLCLGNAKVS
jgi:hypothetical protein